MKTGVDTRNEGRREVECVLFELLACRGSNVIYEVLRGRSLSISRMWKKK